MEHVKHQLLRITSASKTGARVLTLDGSTLALYDCVEWNEGHQEELLAKCPSVGISVRTCPNSLSGFIVVVRGSHRAGTLVWGTLFGLVLAGIYYSVSRLA